MKKLFFSTTLLLCRYGVNPIFLIKIDDGKAIKICGQVKSSFLADCLEIANRNNINQGYIFATNDTYNKPIIKASNNITKNALQQFRNAYNF